MQLQREADQLAKQVAQLGGDNAQLQRSLEAQRAQLQADADQLAQRVALLEGSNTQLRVFCRSR